MQDRPLTLLLRRMAGGDEAAGDELFSLLEDDLRSRGWSSSESSSGYGSWYGIQALYLGNYLNFVDAFYQVQSVRPDQKTCGQVSDDRRLAQLTEQPGIEQRQAE